MEKLAHTVEEAIQDIGDGAVVAIGGFFAAGVPRILLRALIEKKVKDLTLACGAGPLLGAKDELQCLVLQGQVKKVIDSYPLFRSATKGSSHVFEQKIGSGEIALEIYPMGTLAEKYRMAGAGIAAAYIPTGSGSMVEDIIITNIETERARRETREIEGVNCILEYALKPDFALIHAYQGDADGNLRYRKTARSFNPVMAMAARVTIAEVENLVEVGELDSDCIHTPGIYVKKVVHAPKVAFDITNL